MLSRAPLLAIISIALTSASSLAPRPASAQTFSLTAEEQAAFKKAEAGKYIKARELAEKILQDAPDSIVANAILGEVFHEEEARHARALFLLRKAREALETRFGLPPTDAQARIWHKRLIMRENFVLGEMDRKEDQLAMLDLYDAHYRPKLTRMRIWPLMKLGRFDEAREAAIGLTRSDDNYERVSAYNGLMALEDELLDREASYNWGIEGIRVTGASSCILFHNTSQAALTLFDYRESERLARKAITAERQDCPNSSYEHLANIYLLRGRFNEAISAFKKLSTAPIDRRYRSQFAMGNRAILVEVLYALGKVDKGLDFAERVWSAPDRTGMTSVSKDNIRFAHAIPYWMLLRLKSIQLADEGSVRGLGGALDRFIQSQTLAITQFELSRVMLRLGIIDDNLVTNIRPYLRGVKPWYAGNLIRAVGPGLMEAALAEAQLADAPVAEQSRGYYLAMGGEIAFVRGDYEDALRLGADALDAMPADTRLLALRTKTWMAASHMALGRFRDKAMVRMLTEVLQLWPSALLHLDVTVPVRIDHDGQPFSAEVAERLEGSRRLHLVDDAPFVVDVALGDDAVRICLRTAGGQRLGCGISDVDKTDSDEAIAAADAFHQQAFIPQIELTSSDINSLDGSTVRVNADAVLKDLLGPDDDDDDDDDDAKDGPRSRDSEEKP